MSKNLAPTVRAPRASKAKLTQVGIDLLVALAGISIAAMVRPGGSDFLIGAATLLVGWAAFMGRFRLYASRFITRRSDEIRRILDSGVLATAAVAAAAFVFDLEIDRVWLLAAASFGAIGLIGEREVMRRRFATMRAKGELQRQVLLIGDNLESQLLAKMFDEERHLGYDVVDTIDPTRVGDPNELTTRVLQAARDADAGGVVIAATAIEARHSNRLIRDLIEAGIHVELSSTLADIDPSRLTVRPLGRFPVVYVEPVQRHGWRAAAKRTFDLTLATVGVICLSPVLAMLWIAVRRDSEGPVIFKQSRVGKNGEPFDVMKFRTMVTNAEEILAELQEENEGAGPLFKMKDDPRITKVGAFLRKTSLDELPQLFNVIKGEMSLVGPRPALASEMSAWETDLYGRLRVKPGITGMWQVSGRSETTFEEYTRLDLYYVDNWSLVVDLTILARTIPAVLKSDGAY